MQEINHPNNKWKGRGGLCMYIHRAIIQTNFIFINQILEDSLTSSFSEKYDYPKRNVSFSE